MNTFVLPSPSFANADLHGLRARALDLAPMAKPINRADSSSCRSAILASRASRVDGLLVVVLALSLSDLALTLWAMRSIGMAEANPIVIWLVRQFNCAGTIAAFKLMTLAAAGGLLHQLRHHRAAEVGAWLAAVILMALTVQWSLYLNAVRDMDRAQLCQLTSADHGWVRLN